jgi:predicted phosphohydrolase
MEVENQKYNDVKNGWVTFNSNKKKVKLRKFISHRARVLSNVNSSTFKANKEVLIEEFNENGLKGVNNLIRGEFDYYKSKLSKIKEQVKRTEDEKI